MNMASKGANASNGENLRAPIAAKHAIPVLKQRNILGDIKNNPSAQQELVKKTERLAIVGRNRVGPPKAGSLINSKPLLKETTNVAKAIKDSVAKQETAAKVLISEAKSEATVKHVEAFSSYLLPPDICDIDADEDNPQLLSEYVNDIYSHLWSLECKYIVRPNHMDQQSEITPRMRVILIDWLVQVHIKFYLLPETLYLTINLVDRFLQLRSVSRSKLQLVGIASMFTASKYEEIMPPDVRDFTNVTDNAYTKEEILKMEQVILKTLEFHVSAPCALHFLRRNSKAANATGEVHMLSKYLAELCLLEYEMCCYKPSLIASACTYLALQLLMPNGIPIWTPTLCHYTKYTEEKLLPVVDKLWNIVRKQPMTKYQSVKNKYSSTKFMRISMLPALMKNPK